MLIAYRGQLPQVNSRALIQPSAQVIGNVCIGAESSLWFNVVARGDINSIRIGERTNIQDGSIIHVGSDRSVTIGSEVTIGHNSTIHGCSIGDGCLIGMGSIVLDAAVLEAGVLVAAGSLVAPGSHFPAGVLVMGRPAKVKRELLAEELSALRQSADHYVKLLQNYR
ncbi:MAG: gamma carbonic anhydrase family protein [Trichloromonadaceae bacterium]